MKLFLFSILLFMLSAAFAECIPVCLLLFCGSFGAGYVAIRKERRE